MSQQAAHDNKGPKLVYPGVLLVAMFIGFVICLFHAHPTIVFIMASLIPATLAVGTHIYNLHHPSDSLDILVTIWLVCGIKVVTEWIPDVGNWETGLVYSFTVMLLSGSTVLVAFWQQRRLHDDLA